MFNVISLFSGAMGLDLGLEAAGLTTRLALEHDPWCCQTIRINRPELPLLAGDITTISTAAALAAAGLRADEVFLVCGGPPCQPFSTAGKRDSIGDPRGSLFRDFVRFVEEIQPPFFLMENVRGILSAAIKHRPLDRRNDPFAPLDPDELLGSALRVILEEFQRIGYSVNYRLIMAADYGVPQIRERVVFLGSRDGLRVAFPETTHAKRPGAGKLPWVTFGEALVGLHDPTPQFQAYSQERARIFH